MLRIRTLCLGTAVIAALSLSAPASAASAPSANPFAAPSDLPLQAPPFDRIKDSDYAPAFEQGMKRADR